MSSAKLQTREMTISSKAKPIPFEENGNWYTPQMAWDLGNGKQRVLFATKSGKPMVKKARTTTKTARKAAPRRNWQLFMAKATGTITLIAAFLVATGII